MVNACIFDLDGVIVDTAKYHYMAWKRLAGEMGFHFSIEQNEKLKGVSRLESLEILLKVGGIKLSEAEKREAAQKKNAWYVDYISSMNPEEILPGVTSFFDDLRKNRIKIALGSASKNAGFILQRLRLDDCFDTVVDGNKISRAKPDPEIFLISAKELNTDPRECIVFEDAQAGIEAANNAGMISVGVGDPEILEQADLVISGFSNL
ncbi:MAG: beta-phosphoglucomutase, partial [Bacteroidales bacterium]|nr:beta-phosphoglucomutase [Bacteroidales bacterium]